MQVNYGYIQDGKIVAPVAMRSRFDNVGGWHLLTDEQRAKHRWYPCDVLNESYDPATQVREGPILTFTGARITCVYTVRPKTLDEAQQEAHKRINTAYEEATTRLAEGYPENEQKSWATQVKEADIILAGGSEPTPWVDAAAQARGITREALAASIKQNDTLFRQAHGHLTGIRQSLRDQIDDYTETTEDSLRAIAEIDWPRE